MPEVVALRELIEAGAHYGHLTRLLNPKSSSYVYGSRNGISIIDLQKTVSLFKQAAHFLDQVILSGGHILFVGTKRQSSEVVQQEALRCKQFYMNNRWLGGTLTNYHTIKKSILKLKKLEKMSEDGTYDKLTKKEALNFERMRQKLDVNLAGIKDMPGLPGAVFITDVNKENTALLEANHLKIPVVAIVDTNVNPEGVDYPIPGNDDSLNSLSLFVRTIADSIVAAAAQRAQDQVRGGDKSDKKARSKSAHPKRRSTVSSSFRAQGGQTVKVETVLKGSEVADASPPAAASAGSTSAPGPSAQLAAQAAGDQDKLAKSDNLTEKKQQK